ncbi:MAG: hypothetical protein ABI828_05400 [Actinomycetota bacterium]
MRQWELIGITDQVAVPTPASRSNSADTIGDASADHPVFLWNTDTALRLRMVTDVAAGLIGHAAVQCQGRDIIGLFGMEGDSLAILEAHIAALSGETVEFLLHGVRSTVRCTAGPTHDGQDRVIGTLCLAIELEDVDVRESEMSASR